MQLPEFPNDRLILSSSTVPPTLEPSEVLRNAVAVIRERKALVRAAAADITALTGRPAYVHKFTVHISETTLAEWCAALPTAGQEVLNRAVSRPLVAHPDAEMWKWDHGHVAQARAHAELRALFLSPLRRFVRRLTRLLERS